MAQLALPKGLSPDLVHLVEKLMNLYADGLDRLENLAGSEVKKVLRNQDSGMVMGVDKFGTSRSLNHHLQMYTVQRLRSECITK